MPRLIFILAALPIALANFHPARREHLDCFSDQIFCSSTDFGVYAQVIETDDWFANATTIHDLSGLIKSGSLAAKSTGKFEPLCCPIPYSICGLLLPGEVPACYYAGGDINRASKGPLYFLSDMSYGFENTGDYYNIANDHINLITGDYELSTGKQGNWFIDRGERPPAATTHTTRGDKSTITKIGSITRTLVSFPMAGNTARRSSTSTSETTILTTSDHAIQTSTDGAPTSTIANAAIPTSTDAKTNKGAGMSLGARVCCKAVWMAGAAIVLGHSI
ncbi:hypothetical protein V500_08640 [Pseudogymnoascus sp. VKM F-4518 (FW-2643)]|nr:hypothetical protein V500_08640 [Pseudogymnoascus sp. VKM F-4518 (FW-2643)]